MHADDRDDADRRARARTFIGLWQAVDAFDGSTQRLSITCSNRKTCDVRLNDSFFSDCGGLGIGIAQGQGSIEGGVLSVDLTLKCFEGPVLRQLNSFVPDFRNGTLTALNDDDDGAPADVFHRVSR